MDAAVIMVLVSYLTESDPFPGDYHPRSISNLTITLFFSVLI